MKWYALGGFLLLAGYLGQAQQRNNLPALDSLRLEIQMLRAELDSLRSALDPSLTVEDMDALEDRLEDRIQAIDNKIDAVNRSLTPIVFNPRATAFINFSARTDNRSVFDENGNSQIDNRAFLRSVELDFRAPVDPYADAVVILALEDEAGMGYAIDPEEAYGLIKRLPILETSPLGLKLKVGKFRAPFGVNNKLHLHDLPWITRPLAISEYLGAEHGNFFESGFSPVGADLDFLFPRLSESLVLEGNLSLVRAGETGLSQSSPTRQPSFLGHLTLTGDWNNEHLLVLGGSAYREGGARVLNIFGVDATYRWMPVEKSNRMSLMLGGEAFFAEHPDVQLTGKSGHPFGFFTYAQYQLSYWTYLGVRYDYVESSSDELLLRRGLSGFVSYYTTEFLRFRLGFEHRADQVLDTKNMNTALLEINFVFGSHPTEPYWVGR